MLESRSLHRGVAGWVSEAELLTETDKLKGRWSLADKKAYLVAFNR